MHLTIILPCFVAVVTLTAASPILQNKGNEPNSCSPSLEFTCKTGECINADYQCDEDPDCADGSDEENCPGTCNEQKFQCHNLAKCVDISSLCDGNQDCEDSSDEAHCESDGLRKVKIETVMEGETAHMTCLAPVDNGIIWKFGDVVIVADDFVIIGDARYIASREQSQYPHFTTWSLRIENVSAADSGQYLCQISTGTGHIFKPVKLIVNGSTEHNMTCSEEQFQCTPWRTCLDASSVCDGQMNCPDGADEKGCENVGSVSVSSCDEEHFQCNTSGSCVSVYYRCDGDNDCEDGSDEDSCETFECPGFQCTSPVQCLPSWYRCDGDVDCTDGTDEVSCPPNTDDDDIEDEEEDDMDYCYYFYG